MGLYAPYIQYKICIEYIYTLNIIQYTLHSLHLLKGANKMQTLYTSYTISLVKNGHGTLNCSGFSSDWISYSNCRGTPPIVLYNNEK